MVKKTINTLIVVQVLYFDRNCLRLGEKKRVVNELQLQEKN